MNEARNENKNRELLKLIGTYSKPVLSKSVWQLINSVGPYIILWAAMLYLSQISWWLVVPLSILAAGFVVRQFILFHDCGHGSYFRSEYTSEMVGFVMGILTLTPYYRWHNSHMIHHNTAGNLDHRGVGDVWTMTTEEYKNASAKKRLKYRIYRNPVIMFFIGAPLIFLVMNRFTRRDFKPKERMSVYVTNMGVLAIALGISAFYGFKTYLIIQVLITYISSVVGVFLFYVQHQFPDVHWYDDETWEYSTVAIAGSSYFKLPRVLQWFSGNIGFHHIHHLSSRIPNYNLEKCYTENSEFQKVQAITLKESLKTLSLKLWDEAEKKLVTYAQAGV
jgi:acyl-lipid omega-6 desaturase (Delta-12 desaturase)